MSGLKKSSQLIAQKNKLKRRKANAARSSGLLDALRKD